MTAITIRKFRRLARLGILRDCPPPPLPLFLKANLIYGFNGSGKTTLSRIFSCLETGILNPDLPRDCSFEIELTDGSIIRSDGDISGLKGRLLVFNTDFQDRNLRWRAGTANPVFIIGVEQADLAKKLEEVIVEKAKIKEAGEAASQTKKQSETRLETYKRDSARTISEALGLGRKYNALHLTNDYIAEHNQQLPSLSEDEVKKQQAVLAQSAPLVKLPIIHTSAQLTPGFREATRLLATTIGDISLLDIKQHASMLGWIATGLSYHQEKHLDSCLFCGNEFSTVRVKDLSDAINNSFSKFSAEIIQSRQSLARFEETSSSLKLFSPNDISPSVRDSFIKLSQNLFDAQQLIAKITRSLRALLEEKERSPDKEILLSDDLKDIDTDHIDSAVRNILDQINALIATHNSENDAF